MNRIIVTRRDRYQHAVAFENTRTDCIYILGEKGLGGGYWSDVSGTFTPNTYTAELFEGRPHYKPLYKGDRLTFTREITL